MYLTLKVWKGGILFFFLFLPLQIRESHSKASRWREEWELGPSFSDSKSRALSRTVPASPLLPICPLPSRHFLAGTGITDPHACPALGRLLSEPGNLCHAPPWVWAYPDPILRGLRGGRARGTLKEKSGDHFQMSLLLSTEHSSWYLEFPLSPFHALHLCN